MLKLTARIGISWLLLAPLALVADSQLGQTKSDRPGASRDVADLIRDVIQNEIKAEENDHTLWAFRLEKWEDGRDKSFLVCQAREGAVYRLVAINGRALPPKEQEAEKRHVAQLTSTPNEIRDRQKKVAEDAKKVRKLLATIPRAFLFERQSVSGDRVSLHFKPNPEFHPSNHTEAVFHHLEGTITVDARQKRLADVRGTLTTSVKFGGGLFGHLDKGGTFWVSQDDLGSGIWELADVDVRMNGRALLFFKTIAVRQRLIYRKYHRLSQDTTIEQAVEKVLSDDGQSVAARR